VSSKSVALDVLGEAERVVAAVEDDKLRLEHDISPDLNWGSIRSGLDATKACCKVRDRVSLLLIHVF
jgi:hypothetical protein